MEIKGINIDFLGHSGFLIRNGKNIAIDPYNISGKSEKADIVLITHSHYDHCSVFDIEKIAKKGAIIFCTPDCQSKIMNLKNIEIQLVEPGDKIDLNGLKIETIPAYNKRKNFHPKSEGWVGFILKFDNFIIYHSGDSDFIPEMQKLSGYGKHGNYFVCMLPVSGKYVMNAEEAGEVASLISPDLAIPMHYGAGVAGSIEDAEKFCEICKQSNINAKILQKI